MAFKKKEEDKQQQALKMLLQRECNKKCFECDQMGPMYADVTIGSFVCSMCGGILRGLTSPHRIKSISMSSFTPCEIAFLETRGNDYCKSVYLGCYDSRCKAKPDAKNHGKLKIFMEQKYIQKRWYVAPEIANQPEKNSVNVHVNKEPVETFKTKVDPPKGIQSSAIKPAKSDHNQRDLLSSPLLDLSPVLPSTSISVNASREKFANFNQAFPPVKFDIFGSNNTQSAKTESPSVSFSHGDTTVFAPSSTNCNPTKSASSNSVDKYADLRDLFKIETIDRSTSLDMWSNCGNLNKLEASMSTSFTGSTPVTLQSVNSNSTMAVFGGNNLVQTTFNVNRPTAWSTPGLSRAPTSVSSLASSSLFQPCHQIPQTVFQPIMTPATPVFGSAQVNNLMPADRSVYSNFQSYNNGNIQSPNQFGQSMMIQQLQNPFAVQSSTNPFINHPTNSNPFANPALPQQPINPFR